MSQTMLDTPSVGRRSLLLGGAASRGRRRHRSPAGPGRGQRLVGRTSAARAPVAGGRTQGHRLRLVDRHLAARRRVPQGARPRGRADVPRGRPALVPAQADARTPARLHPRRQVLRHAPSATTSCIIGAHLVWDEGFGEGWTDDDLWELNRRQAEKLLYGTVRKEVRHYKGRAERVDRLQRGHRPRGRNKPASAPTSPGTTRIGKEYIAKCFRIAAEEDPKAELRIINEFGFETVNEYGDRPEDRRKAFLQVVDMLLDTNVPLHAVGIQAHLLADRFKRALQRRGLPALPAARSPTAA